VHDRVGDGTPERTAALLPIDPTGVEVCTTALAIARPLVLLSSTRLEERFQVQFDHEAGEENTSPVTTTREARVTPTSRRTQAASATTALRRGPTPARMTTPSRT